MFSPDGSEIAFVQRSVAAGYQRQYAIPNHRDAPIYFDWLAGDGDQYMLHERNLITSIAAWQP